MPYKIWASAAKRGRRLLFGQVVGLPLCELLGAGCDEDFVLYRAIPKKPPESMAKLVAKRPTRGCNGFRLNVLGWFQAEDRKIPGEAVAHSRRRAICSFRLVKTCSDTSTFAAILAVPC